MANFKFTRSTEADCHFYDEKGEYFESSVKAFFKSRTDKDIAKKMNGYGNISIPILGEESQLQFECNLADDGSWELDFIGSIGS